MNEDSILALPELGVWTVSDGMGGHTAGALASQTVIECLSTIPPGQHPTDLMASVRSALKRAHDLVQTEVSSETAGATVVTLVISSNHFVSFWVGDSRLYLRRDAQTRMLTTDHSVVAELVLAGQISWDQADQHPNSNSITRAIGVGDALEIDKVRGDVQSGDRFLLCSDGLTKYAPMDLLDSILASEPIETIAETLLRVALDAGGADNVSIIVVDVP